MPLKPQPAYPTVPIPGALPGDGDPFTLPQGAFRLLVSGSPEPSSPALVSWLAARAEQVVAVDSGATACRRADVVPDLLLGDLDSVPDEVRSWCASQGVAEKTTNWDKDETDLELALDYLEEEGPGGFTVVTCGTGGRLDQLLASLGSVASHPRQAPVLVEDGMLALVLCAGGRRSAVRLDDVGCVAGTTFSVIGLMGRARVTEKGTRWDVESKVFPALSNQGVSNYVVDPGRAQVSVEEGIALLVLPRTGW